MPDYVHRHRVRFQLIYCYRGWVRVVYEDQGPPFVLQAGDAVLQPPEIRHRVLESSAGLEVIEVSCPAEHETLADLELELPTPVARPERDFGGQRFVRHQASRADWAPWRVPGFEARDLGIAAATRGLPGAQVVRRARGRPGLPGADAPLRTHDAELLFNFVLTGAASCIAKATAGVASRRRLLRDPCGPRRTRCASAAPTWSCWRSRYPPTRPRTTIGARSSLRLRREVAEAGSADPFSGELQRDRHRVGRDIHFRRERRPLG